MGWFSPKEEKSTTQDSEASKSGVWGSQLDSALLEARKSRVENAEGKQGGGKTAGKSGGRPGLSSSLTETAKKMFDPEAWRAIVRMPFSLGRVITGRGCWDLDKKQEDVLATSTSATAEYFLQVDPKYVVLTLFMMNWSAVLTEKFMENAVERRKELALNPPPESTENNGSAKHPDRPYSIVKPTGINL